MLMCMTVGVTMSMDMSMTMSVLMLMIVFMAVSVIMTMLMIMSMPVFVAMSMTVSMTMIPVMMMVIAMMMVPVMMMVIVMVMVRLRFGPVVVQRDLPLGHVRVGMSDDRAQHVRLARQVACAGAVADRLDDHRREALRELVHDAGDNAGPCGCRHLELIRRRRDRQALHHL
jgi:hypothetical protein